MLRWFFLQSYYINAVVLSAVDKETRKFECSQKSANETLRKRVAIPLASYGWETDPKLEMAEKWLAKWPAAIFRGGPRNGRKMAGQMAGQAEMAKFQLSGHLPGLFFGHFGDSPKNGRRPFRQPFFGHFQFRACFPPVAGQRNRNKRVQTQVRKGAQKGAKERRRALPRKNR